jgi:hypothetical protein
MLLYHDIICYLAEFSNINDLINLRCTNKSINKLLEQTFYKKKKKLC